MHRTGQRTGARAFSAPLSPFGRNAKMQTFCIHAARLPQRLFVMTSARSLPPLPASANADLHCHSTASDGTLQAEELASRAAANGVQLWSLTDHDEISAQARAREAAHSHGLRYLTGVEISVSYAGDAVHIVGLGFDLDEQSTLARGLAANRGGRGPRAEKMAAGLEKAGIKGAYEGALRHAGNPDLLSRTHFARFLVESGVCRDTHEVFRKYLIDGKPGYVPHHWASLGETIEWITQAGGVAVIAHPARYRLKPVEKYALFTEFKARGGHAIEVVTGSHTAAEATHYASIAREFGLAASRGSDFHSPSESRTQLGQLPPLPPNLTAVWQLPQLAGRY